MHKNIERHIADAIVSWHNPKQWVIVLISCATCDSNNAQVNARRFRYQNPAGIGVVDMCHDWTVS